MINAGIIGATGYVGAELMRLLKGHGGVKICRALSKNFAGKKMGDVYANFLDGEDELSLDMEDMAESCDYIFLCLPHGQSMAAAKKLYGRGGAKIIDLSGDFRYEDTGIYEQWYGIKHDAGDINAAAVYGLPEYNRDRIKRADFVANPGCYTTTSILALAPLLREGLIKTEGIVIDAKSGVTGAGRKESLAFSYCETADNFKAYSPTMHRHTSEIEEQLSLLGGREVKLLFTPHLLPVKRGILATCYTELAEGVSEGDIKAAYEKVYKNEPFTHVLAKGSLPELKQVVGSNNCVIGYDVSERTGRLIVVACTDNLLKGAAGQAVQNLNIMCGFNEDSGLAKVAWYL